MKMNKTLAYGMAALESLAELGGDGQWIRVQDLARRGNLPPAYLNKILQALVEHGMVESSRGRGYRLIKTLDQISVWEMMESFTFNGAPEKKKPDFSPKLCATLKSQVSDWLEGLTMEDIVESAKTRSEQSK